MLDRVLRKPYGLLLGGKPGHGLYSRPTAVAVQGRFPLRQESSAPPFENSQAAASGV